MRSRWFENFLLFVQLRFILTRKKIFVVLKPKVFFSSNQFSSYLKDHLLLKSNETKLCLVWCWHKLFLLISRRRRFLRLSFFKFNFNFENRRLVLLFKIALECGALETLMKPVKSWNYEFEFQKRSRQVGNPWISYCIWWVKKFHLFIFPLWFIMLKFFL